MQAFLVSTGIVALGEMGDKTQLLAVLLAARFRRPVPIVLGILVATLANHAMAGALGGLRSLSHLNPLMANAQCWIAPKQFALGRAADAFEDNGELKLPAQRDNVLAVVKQVLWAAERLGS